MALTHLFISPISPEAAQASHVSREGVGGELDLTSPPTGHASENARASPPEEPSSSTASGFLALRAAVEADGQCGRDAARDTGCSSPRA